MNLVGWTRLEIWIAAFFTLAVYSYLIKENVFYRFAEHTFLALAIGRSLCLSVHLDIIPYYNTHIVEDGRWWFLLFLPLGALYYTRSFGGGKYGWLASYPICLSMGWGLGYTIARGARSTMVQLADTMGDLHVFDNLLFLLIWACVMMYFFLTVGKTSKTVGTCGKIGRYFMMIMFGAGFGNTIQGRISLFLGRLQFLLRDWIQPMIGH